MATSVRAEEPPERAGEHEHVHVLHLGVMGTALGAFVDGEAFAAAGGGLFLTWVVVHGRFELELSARALATEGGVELTQDLLAKVPFHVNHWFHPFLALGPTVAEYFVAGEAPDAPRRRGWGIGGAASLGADFWIKPRFGVVVEVNYNLLYRWLRADTVTTGGLVNELGGSAGVLVAF